MESIVDNNVVKNYVSPRHCQALTDAGFGGINKFFWKVYLSDIILDTNVFDIDKYYEEGNLLVDYIAPLKMRLPAYTIKEIEEQLPDYCLCKQDGGYEIMLDGKYNVDPITNVRLADAFALMLLAMLKKRLIDPLKLSREKKS